MIPFLLTFALLANVPAQAATPPAKTLTFSGQLRYFDFTRFFKTGTNQSAGSLGAKLHFDIRTRSGFGAGATYYSANALGDTLITPAQLEKTLPGYTVNTLAEEYVQHQGTRSLARAGRQIVKTPWAGPADTRMIPVAFEGLSFGADLTPTWSVSIYRMLRYKSRTNNAFTNDTLLTTTTAGGFFAAGVTHRAGPAKIQLWNYHFNDIADLDYVEFSQSLSTSHHWTPTLSAQYGLERNTGSHLLGSIRTNVFGSQLALVSRQIELSLGYDRIPVVNGTYKNGAFVSPYTAGITGDPLYTTPIAGGLIDKVSPGRAYKATATFYSANRQIRAIVARTRLDLPASANARRNELYETDVDLTYALTKEALRSDNPHGLTLRNRLVLVDTSVSPFNAGQERLIFEYNW
jgi:hypothetical protein